jgi:hypothetical protein
VYERKRFHLILPSSLPGFSGFPGSGEYFRSLPYNKYFAIAERRLTGWRGSGKRRAIVSKVTPTSLAAAD